MIVVYGVDDLVMDLMMDLEINCYDNGYLVGLWWIYVGGIMWVGWVGLCWWIYVGCGLMFSVVICFNVKKNSFCKKRYFQVKINGSRTRQNSPKGCRTTPVSPDVYVGP